MRSPSKAAGYWNNPSVTAEDFHAAVHPLEPSGGGEGKESSPDGYLRTGDLGFMLQGELFVCGRSKDLIIVRGTNHYPQDMERSVEGLVGELRPGCSAAFALPSEGLGTERVVFIGEVGKPILLYTPEYSS